MQQMTNSEKALVPIGVTIGLLVFALILGVAGFVVKIVLFGETIAQVLPQLVRMVAIFWLLIPCGFMLGAKIINKFSGKLPILPRNALTLGLLISCVSMLWLMAGNG